MAKQVSNPVDDWVELDDWQDLDTPKWQPTNDNSFNPSLIKPRYGERVLNETAAPFTQFNQGVRQIARMQDPREVLTGAQNVGQGLLGGLLTPLNFANSGIKQGTGVDIMGSIMSPINSIVGGIEKGIDNLVGSTPQNNDLTPQGLKDRFYNQQLADATHNTNVLAAGSMLPSGLGKASDVTRGVVGSVAKKVLPNPEGVYSRAANLGWLDKGERSAAKTGVQDKIDLGGTYNTTPEKYNAILDKKQSIIENQITPAIDELTQKGNKVVSSDLADKAYNEMIGKRGHPLLRGISKDEYVAKLNQFKDEFLKNNPQDLTPSEMQTMKTATHEQVAYDKYGTLQNAWEKALARQMKTKLEEWNPELKKMNQKWADLHTLGESMSAWADKQGNVTKSPYSSMPFYMAIGDPLRGATLSEARSFAKLPQVRTRLAFAIDDATKIGQKKSKLNGKIAPPFIARPKDKGQE